MKIEYSILWLDDKKSDIIDDNFAEELQNYIANEGFEPNINLVSNEEEFFKNLNDSYDLILTDYHLNETDGNSRDGDKIIAQVRELNVNTEIMFYSAQGDVADTIKKDRITFVDTRKISGTVHYEKIIGKAKDLISLTIKKFQQIVPMRGLLIQEASNLENEMLEIITKYLHKKDSDSVKNAIFTDVTAFYKRKFELADKSQKSNNINQILRDPLLISSAQRAVAIKQILKDEGKENFIDDFKNEIIKMRNDFAHAKYIKDSENGIEYFQTKTGNIIFDAELCRTVRANLVKHKINIEDLNSFIGEMK